MLAIFFKLVQCVQTGFQKKLSECLKKITPSTSFDTLFFLHVVLL